VLSNKAADRSHSYSPGKQITSMIRCIQYYVTDVLVK